MTIAYVQSAIANVQMGVSDHATTAAISTSAGNLVVAQLIYDWGQGGAVTLTDSLGQTWATSVSEVTGPTNTRGREMYVANNTGNASHTFTITCNLGALESMTIIVIEISGAAASPLDKTAILTGAGNSSPYTTDSTSATAQAHELLLGLGYSDNFSSSTLSVSAPWTQTKAGSLYPPAVSAYQNVTSTGTYAFTWTDANNFTERGWISTWKEAAGASVGLLAVGGGGDGSGGGIGAGAVGSAG